MNKNPISSEKLKLSFTQAANSLTLFYQESLKAQSEAYLEGQIDALNDILNYCLQNSAGDIRNISTSSLIEYMNLKLMEYNGKKNEFFNGNNLQNTQEKIMNGLDQNKLNDTYLSKNQYNK